MKRHLTFTLNALFALASLDAALAKIVITGETRVLVDPREPLPVQKAARDLASDLGKVFGTEARVVQRREEAGATVIAVSLHHNLPLGVARPGGVESYRIAAVENAWSERGGAAVALAGADARGTIYAVYEFAQRFLGVDPLYYWTDHEPRKRSRIELPEGTNIVGGTPSFRYRGWFINDEDLLTGWKPGEPGKTGIALEVWDRVFEALLRLKGNMIVPGTFIFPDEPQVRLAAERGLIVTQHHIEVLGTNTYGWPDERPYSFSAHPELLISAWRNAVKGYLPGQEVIWTLGYRGRHDRPFWVDDNLAGSTDSFRGQIIRKATDTQMAIVREERRNPSFLMNAWEEAVPLIQGGFLRIPDGVMLVWPDNGHGLIRDGGRIRKGEGVYYHTAMHNFMANQLAEMVPLERIQRELGRAAREGATEYLLVNTSDIRPVVMTTRAVMELAWDAAPWVKPGGREHSLYLERWVREQFGDLAAQESREYYNSFFDAPARYGGGEADTMADCAYHTLARTVLTGMITGKPELPRRFEASGSFHAFASSLVKTAAEAEPRWAKARSLADRAGGKVPAGRQGFFQSHIRTQLDVNEFGNRMLKNVAQAWLAPTATEKKRLLEQAAKDTALVLDSYKASEYGKWAGFFKEERFTNVRLTLAMTRAAIGVLDGKPVPQGLPVQARTPDPYPWLKEYQQGRRVRVSDTGAVRRDPRALLADSALLARPAELRSVSDRHNMVFQGRQGESQFNLHSYIAFHDGRFWAVWSSSRVGEEDPDQLVRYASSPDGRNWGEAGIVTGDPDGPDGPARWICRGLFVLDGRLTALAARIESADYGKRGKDVVWRNLRLMRFEWNGQRWVERGMLAGNCMNNFPPGRLGKLWMMPCRDSRMDPFVAMSAELEPSGWKRQPLESAPPFHRMDEPTWYQASDGTVHLIVRDNAKSGYLIRIVSRDSGASWEKPVLTNYPDATSKNFTGRLSNGWYFLINNPDQKKRDPLAVSFSRDGWTFEQPWAIRRQPPPRRYEGRAKASNTVQYPHAVERNGSLWVIYSTNKEDIEVSELPLRELLPEAAK